MTQHDIRAEQAIASATDASITSDAAQSPLDKLDALLNPSPAVEEAPAVESGFAKLGLDAAILRALSELNYNTPTPVQAQAIPAFLAGRDLLVSSQTGSGKTAAFMLPAIQRISERYTPTRERLRMQSRGLNVHLARLMAEEQGLGPGVFEVPL